MPSAEVGEDKAERAIAAIEAFADKYIAKTEMHEAIAVLGKVAPLPFRDRTAAQIEAMVRQAYIEAFYAGFNYHKDGAALRDAGAEGMRERCAKVALQSCYGPPSTWPNEFPRGWKTPNGWPLLRAPTPAEAAMHDNWCMDTFIAIRALPTVEGDGS